MTKKQKIEELEQEIQSLKRDISRLDCTDTIQRAKINELTKENMELEQRNKNLEFMNRQLIIGISYSEDKTLANLVLNLATKYKWHF